MIDVDKPDTWPAQLTTLLVDLDRRVSKNRYVADLGVPHEARADVHRAMAGHTLLAHHFTRLLPHEADMIREQGLRLYSAELFDERIEAAHERGFLTAGQRDQLKAGHIPAAEHSRQTGRSSAVFMVAGQRIMAEKSAIQPLLQTWGGEGIYFSSVGLAHAQSLGSLGTPAVVQVALPINGSRDVSARPDLARLFLGSYRGKRYYSDLAVRVAVPSSAILSITVPGDAVYDRWKGLPAS